ncbi:MAG: hypothetical protein GY854_15225 [Deltaproteobacteria bacterium]|nr:hypothetical protein [Deltaproteobacteria bacterium]
MKTISNKNVITKSVAIQLLAGLALIGCAPEFDDPTMAVVKKPEILSVVLSPPEAVPGQTVRATFLMADDRGVIEDNANVWMPMGASDEDMEASLAKMEIDLESLGEAEFEFKVPPASSFTFDEDGLSGQMVSLFAATGNTPSPETPIEQLLGSLESLVESGDVKTALRTLVVSERSNRNQNPLILDVTAGDEETQDTPVSTVRSDDRDIPATRQSAADNPLVVKENESIFFAVDVEDDSNDAISLRYQWISTGGDFAGLRRKVQEFKAPEFQELESGDEDQTDLENVNPRVDPNLHPVWLVIRDNGISGGLGQSWVEFYVRVEPAE